MAWVKIDDQFASHPKILKAGPAAAWLYVCGLTYCNRYLTDGFIPAEAVRLLTDLKNPGKEAAKLVNAGLWEIADGGYIVHDYLDWNPSAEQIRSERRAARQRMERLRSARVRANFARTSHEVPRPDADADADADANANSNLESLPGEGGKGGEPTTAAADADAEVDVTPTEAETLRVLKTVPGYRFRHADDLPFIRELAHDFPDVDLLAEVKLWRDSKRDSPLKATSMPRKQLRNWLLKAREIAARRAIAREPPLPGYRDWDEIEAERRAEDERSERRDHAN